MAVIPNEEIQYFCDTIRWIMNIENNGSQRNLPPIAVKIDNYEYNDQPKMMVYARRSDDYSLPYMYAEIRIAVFIFVFIVPYSTKDKILFDGDENFDMFWKFNKHYSHFNDWVFNKYNIDIAKETIFNMNMTRREPDDGHFT
jgi:hypothetical protein